MICDRNFSENRIFEFLLKENDEFPLSLDEQLKKNNTNLTEFSKKLSQKATIAYEEDNAEIKGMVIGYVHDLPKDMSSYITYVIVDKNYRRQGVAKRLLTEYIDYAIKNNVKSVWLTTGKINYSAQLLYENVGFKKHCENEKKIKYILELGG